MNKVSTPILTPWLAGDQLNEDMMNEVQDAMEFLLQPPECKIIKTNAQTIPSVTWTDISFTGVAIDNCAPFGSPMWSSGTPVVITCVLPGWYECKWVVAWAGATDNAKRVGEIRWNNEATGDGRGRLDKFHLNDRTIAQAEAAIFMNTGDTIRLSVWQNKGSNTDVTMDGVPTEPARQTTLHAKWVSL